MPSFNDYKLKPSLTKALALAGYEQPTPIQAKSIPHILHGRDLVGQAETGSGKTAAYAIPLLQQVNARLPQLQSVVVVPTRELALQVNDELKKLGKFIRSLKVVAFYGGHTFGHEAKSLQNAPHIVVATPGRLNDHLNRKTLSLETVKTVVLDETDKLLEFGFLNIIERLLNSLPKERQLLFFAATFTEKLLELVRWSLVHPEVVKTEPTALPDTIEQSLIVVEDEERLPALARLLSFTDSERSLVFCNTRQNAAQLCETLAKQGYQADLLHGRQEQDERHRAMVKLRNGSTRLLVTTDLAARGIDVLELDMIVQYEIPNQKSAFLHRTGRTGRAGNHGRAFALANNKQAARIEKWKDVHIAQTINFGELEAALSQIYDAKKAANLKGVSPRITLQLNAGKKEKVNAGDIVGALVKQAGVPHKKIGKIEVYDHYGFVAVPRAKVEHVVRKLSEGKIKNRKVRVSIVE